MSELFDRVIARLREMSDGKTPVSTRTLTTSLGEDYGKVGLALRKAAKQGLVTLHVREGWVPVAEES